MNSMKYFRLGVAFMTLLSVLTAQTSPADGSRANLKAIARAVKAFEALHEKAPSNLEMLVEGHLLANASLLVIPGFGRTPPARGEADARGDYLLAPVGDTSGLVAREKTPTHTPGEVLGIFKDGTIKSIAASGGGADRSIAPGLGALYPSAGVPASAPPPGLFPAVANSAMPPASSRSTPSGPPGIPRDVSAAPPAVAPVSPAPTTAAQPALASRSAATPAAPTAAVGGASAKASDGNAWNRINDWLAGRPVTPPGKTEAIAPILGGSAPVAVASGGAGTEGTSSAGAARAHTPDTPAGAPVDLASTRALLEKLLGQRPGATEAITHATQSSERMRELQQRLGAELSRSQQTPGAATLSPQAIEIMLEMEQFTRPRTPAPVAVTTSAGFVPPPTANANVGDVFDQIHRAARGEPTVHALPPTASGSASAPASLPSQPAGGTKRTGPRQFVHGVPWSSASWSEAQARAASEAGHAAERAKDYAKVVSPFTDLAGYGLAKDPRENSADKLLESVAWYQERQLGPGNSPELAYTRNNLGVIYTASGTYGAADSEFTKAQQIWDAQPASGEASEEHAVMLRNFAVLREKQGNATEAARLTALADALLAKRR